MDNTCDGLLLYSVGGETLLTSVASHSGALFTCICYLDSSTDFLMLLNILYGITCNLILTHWGTEFHTKVDLSVHITSLCTP